MTFHLHDAGQEREQNAVRTLLRVPSIADDFFSSLGIGYPFCWLACHFELRPALGMDGEIDLIGGPLQLRDGKLVQNKFSELRAEFPDWPDSVLRELALKFHVEDGGVVWPPTLDQIVAVEAKACYVKGPHSATTRADYKSTKLTQIKLIAKQIDRSRRLGFDAVSFLDLIAVPPQGGNGIEAWANAAFHAADAVKNSDFITSTRLGEDRHTGHWVMVFGAVGHKEESFAGSPQKKLLQVQKSNPLRNDPSVKESRVRLNTALARWLTERPPLSYPHVIFDRPDYAKQP